MNKKGYRALKQPSNRKQTQKEGLGVYKTHSRNKKLATSDPIDH